MSIQIGKAKIEITSKGCIKCGTQFSRAWFIAETHTVVIRKKQITIEVYICGDCHNKTQLESNDGNLPFDNPDRREHSESEPAQEAARLDEREDGA